MRSLDTARAVCERLHPGLIKRLDALPLLEREAPGSSVLDIFRAQGGAGLTHRHSCARP